MEPTTLLGSAAGLLTTIAFIPQVAKIWRSQSAEDISAGTFFLFATGVLLWLLYGIAIQAAPVIAANAVTLMLAVTIVILKYHYRHRRV